MAKDKLFRIKKWIITFFSFVIMVQAGFVCYASAMPSGGDLALQLQHAQQLGSMLTIGLVLNLVVVLVAAYGFNISIVNSIRDK